MSLILMLGILSLTESSDIYSCHGDDIDLSVSCLALNLLQVSTAVHRAKKDATENLPETKSQFRDTQIQAEAQAPQIFTAPQISTSTSWEEKLTSFENVSHSEFHQDVYVYKTFFQNMTLPGVVLEMGALDGIAGSNSLAFQKALNWHTILIEANPTMKAYIEKNRKGADIHMNAICSEPGNLTYLQTSSPGLDCFEEYAKTDTLFRKMKEFDAKIVAKIPVECKRLDDLGLPDVIDVFFLDVEGAELTVLKTMDFNRTCVRVFNIEAGGPDTEVGKLLISNGFNYFGSSPEVSWDHVWVNPATCKSSAAIDQTSMQKV